MTHLDPRSLVVALAYITPLALYVAAAISLSGLALERQYYFAVEMNLSFRDMMMMRFSILANLLHNMAIGFNYALISAAIFLVFVYQMRIEGSRIFLALMLIMTYAMQWLIRQVATNTMVVPEEIPIPEVATKPDTA